MGYLCLDGLVCECGADRSEGGSLVEVENELLLVLVEGSEVVPVPKVVTDVEDHVTCPLVEKKDGSKSKASIWASLSE
jgi:hypothetical protein